MSNHLKRSQKRRPRCRMIKNRKCVNKLTKKEEKLIKLIQAEYKKYKKQKKRTKKIRGGG